MKHLRGAIKTYEKKIKGSNSRWFMVIKTYEKKIKGNHKTSRNAYSEVEAAARQKNSMGHWCVAWW